MGEKFHYDHSFKASKEEVFQEIISWLKREGAQTTMVKAPDKLEAIHGSMTTLKVWNITAEKRMSFVLSEDSNGVNVALVMEPAALMDEQDAFVYRNKIQASWEQLANGIWASVERSKVA